MNPSSQGRTFRILGILGGIIAFVLLMIWIGNAQDRANDPQVLDSDVTANDWAQGNGDAGVTIVEYSDFQCPACQAYYPVMQGLHEAFGDDLKIVYRHYPLSQIHKNAQLAAQAAEAAGIQGKFFEMHDLLFEGQDEWSDLSDPTSTFMTYAERIILDVDQFSKDLTSSGVKNAVAEDVRSANRAGISGTPTFFLNGVQISNPQGLQPFIDLIEEEIASHQELKTEEESPYTTSDEAATE